MGKCKNQWENVIQMLYQYFVLILQPIHVAERNSHPAALIKTVLIWCLCFTAGYNVIVVHEHYLFCPYAYFILVNIETINLFLNHCRYLVPLVMKQLLGRCLKLCGFLWATLYILLRYAVWHLVFKFLYFHYCACTNSFFIILQICLE